MRALEQITEKAQSDIAEAFYESAKANAATTNGLLVAYEPDFERFPYRLSLSVRRDRREVIGSPLTPEKTFEVVELVDKRCHGLREAIERADAKSGALTSMQYVLESEQDVIAAADHQELVDIAFLAAGSSAILRSRKVEHLSGLVLSKAASDYLGVNLDSFGWPLETVEEYLKDLGLEALEDHTVPVRDFLTLAVDVQFLVIPNTASFSQLRGLQQEAVEAHNTMVKRDIRGAMNRRGVRQRSPMALFNAAPGTKNKKLDTANYWENYKIPGHHVTIPENLPTNIDDIDVIGRISPGMIKYAKHALTYPYTIRLSDDENPVVAMDAEFETLLDDKRILRFAAKLLKLVDELDGTTTVYDVKGNLKTRS